MSAKELALKEEQVAHYLSENPEFFHNKEYLIHDLTIPHERGGTISIVERQMVLLRERNKTLQEKINTIILNAEHNGKLFEKIRLIILELLRCSSLTELTTAIEKKLSSDFDASACKLVFIGGKTEKKLPVTSSKKVLGELYDRQRTICGPLSDKQSLLLFPEEKEIVSAAIIPIHLRNEELIAALGSPLLVVGSDKAEHFNSGQDTLFLDFIGEVIASYLIRIN